jgi:hypothetical protein
MTEGRAEYIIVEVGYGYFLIVSRHDIGFGYEAPLNDNEEWDIRDFVHGQLDKSLRKVLKKIPEARRWLEKND